MLRSTFPVPRLRPVRPSRVGDNPRDDRAPALRRLAGALALLALLAALPAPALAAPAGDSQSGPHLVVLAWLQGLLDSLGFAPVPVAERPEGPVSQHERTDMVMDPDGVTSNGKGSDGSGSQTISATTGVPIDG